MLAVSLSLGCRDVITNSVYRRRVSVTSVARCHRLTVKTFYFFQFVA